VPRDHTILYETHVKEFTRLHLSVPQKIRGTYAGLGTKDLIHYVKALGITSVELLPIHTMANDSDLLDKGSPTTGL
jgi:glycogen operon protein